jgi:hypothetical protein
MINEATMRRLAFVRYMYDLGMEQSRQPEPMYAASLLTLHDCSEFFLQLAAEHVGVGGSQSVTLMAYWQRINDKLTTGQIAHDAGMRRLNDARAAFKHHGMYPSRLTIETARATVTSFLSDSTPLVFGIEFDSVSMLHLVTCEATRLSLEQAAHQMQNGESLEAVIKCGLAFVHLMDDYGERIREKYGYNARFFSGFQKARGSKLDALDKLVDRVSALEEDLRIMSSHLDYRRYRKFRFLVPPIVMTHGGDYQVFKARMRTPTMEECRFCFDFVIDSAIRLQEFDYEP